MLLRILLMVFLATPVLADETGKVETAKNAVLATLPVGQGKPEFGSDKALGAEGDPGEEDGEPKKRDWISENIVLFLGLLYSGVFLVIGGIILFVWLHARRKLRERTEALTAMSEELGLMFQPEGDADLLSKLGSMPLFNIGRSRKLTNLFVADTPDLKMEVFDYSFVTGHGKSRKDHRMTVLRVRADGLGLPALHARPRRAFFDAIRRMFGGQDIKLPNYPAFSRMFVLKSDEADQSCALLDSELVERFKSHPEFSFECERGAFIYYRRNKRIDPTAVAMHELMGAGFSMHQAVTERLQRDR